MGFVALAQNQLGRAPTDIDHQASFIGLRERMGGPLVDEARLFGARNYADGVAQDGAALANKGIAVDRLAQGLRGHGPHMCCRKAL